MVTTMPATAPHDTALPSPPTLSLTVYHQGLLPPGTTKGILSPDRQSCGTAARHRRSPSAGRPIHAWKSKTWRKPARFTVNACPAAADETAHDAELDRGAEEPSTSMMRSSKRRMPSLRSFITAAPTIIPAAYPPQPHAAQSRSSSPSLTSSSPGRPNPTSRQESEQLCPLASSQSRPRSSHRAVHRYLTRYLTSILRQNHTHCASVLYTPNISPLILCMPHERPLPPSFVTTPIPLIIPGVAPHPTVPPWAYYRAPIALSPFSHAHHQSVDARPFTAGLDEGDIVQPTETRKSIMPLMIGKLPTWRRS
ncbi:hypothetical protein FB451DRAFT_1490735 [Mycena latifolia]|nr:hypothetical protein FB451DRAFT_1490735 [Mycena latifolia]